MGDIYVNNNKFVDHKITNKITVSKDLEKYIRTYEMFTEYDCNIHADESILNIPIIANIVPLAWLTGSDIHVENLDKTFKESLDQLQSHFKEFYPLIPFNTDIKAERLVDNKITPEDLSRRTGLLFSGGVDATYSMITNLTKKPRLIMYWGVERSPYPKYRDYWERVIEQYTHMANSFGLDFNIVKTNVLEILNLRRIEHRYHKELFYGSLWVRLQESLVLLSLAAPLSFNRFDKILIAASEWPDTHETLDIYNRPHIARPESDEIIKWANLNVDHDGFIDRLTKIKTIAEYLNHGKILLRVCLSRKDAPNALNCNQCEKCCRTIAQLVQAKVDPNKCGFDVSDSTPLNIIKEYYLKVGLDCFAENSKKMIPDKLECDLYGSKQYLKWLKEFNVPEQTKELFFRDIYDFLPYPLAKILAEIYKILKIEIHFGNPKLPKQRIEKITKISNNHAKINNEPKKSQTLTKLH